MGTLAICQEGRLEVPTKVTKINSMWSLKQSDEWTKLNIKLDNYTTDYVIFTNKMADAQAKIDLVADASTKQALNKLIDAVNKQYQMLDDVHDAVAKMKKIIVDVTNIQ